MSKWGHGLSPEQVERVREVYDSAVELVDEGVEIFDSERDALPLEVLSMLGGRSLINTVTVRYKVLELPAVSASPYYDVLARTPVIAFERQEREMAGMDDYRRIEFLDPGRVRDGVTLMMVGLEDRDIVHPDLPRASVHNNVNPAFGGTPFLDPRLTEELNELTFALKEMVQDEMLEPVSYMELQDPDWR